MPNVLTLSALVIRDRHGRLLLVRKRGTSMFMQPGGKLEPGETFAAAAVRELEEELGIRVGESELEALGHWYGPAANEARTFIDAALFACSPAEDPVPAAEIEEFLWLDLAEAGSRTDLAPLLTEHVIPLLAAVPRFRPGRED
ncbi:NUDIX hydrolase [Arthrobacter mobilis]|uniref:NUDIX domain-containing protein n=1 Tax=Arthrobacter mobilis TaxID=2724944 RepID=A0A7X6HA71_9MICC|nr:NUDIX domain-containing protein [Arthrobacter mobilis]NKX53314.1 NUDIX domain-containing protein [Arthrobacter mobilis]